MHIESRLVPRSSIISDVAAAASPVVAITGANGYVGSIICNALRPHARVIPLVRNPRRAEEVAWSLGASEVDIVRLLAAHRPSHIIHVAWDMKSNDVTQLMKTCVEGTARLLDSGRLLGIANFLFISSLSSFENARSAYGRSKFLAERQVIAHGGVVLRLGLVFGGAPGGVFGGLSRMSARLPVLPNIIGGSGVQFLLHQRSLSAAIVRAVKGDFAGNHTITLAHPRPVPLVQVLNHLASGRMCRPLLVPVPWRAIYLALRCAEIFRLPTAVRSDSLLGFVHQDPEPDFTPLRVLHIEMEPWASCPSGR